MEIDDNGTVFSLADRFKDKDLEYDKNEVRYLEMRDGLESVGKEFDIEVSGNDVVVKTEIRGDNYYNSEIYGILSGQKFRILKQEVPGNPHPHTYICYDLLYENLKPIEHLRIEALKVDKKQSAYGRLVHLKTEESFNAKYYAETKYTELLKFFRALEDVAIPFKEESSSQ